MKHLVWFVLLITLNVRAFDPGDAETEAGAPSLQCVHCGGTPTDRRALPEIPGLSCRAEQLRDQCVTLFRRHPELARFARDCEQGPRATENYTELRAMHHDFEMSCRQAMGESWLWVWNGIQRQMARNGRLQELCEASSDCKINLALEAHRIRAADLRVDENGRYVLSESQARMVADLDVGDLLRKRRDVIQMADRDPAYRQRLIADGVPLPADNERAQINLGPMARALRLNTIADLARRYLTGLQARMSCLNSEGAIRMMCAGIATVADPTALIAGRSVAAATSVEDLTATALRGARLEIQTSLRAVEASGDAARTLPAATVALVGPSAERALVMERSIIALGRVPDPDLFEEILRAHRVGRGRPGPSGRPSGFNNLTFAQLEERLNILMAAGLRQDEAAAVIRSGAAGDMPVLEPARQRVVTQRTDQANSALKLYNTVEDGPEDLAAVGDMLREQGINSRHLLALEYRLSPQTPTDPAARERWRQARAAFQGLTEEDQVLVYSLNIREYGTRFSAEDRRALSRIVGPPADAVAAAAPTVARAPSGPAPASTTVNAAPAPGPAPAPPTPEVLERAQSASRLFGDARTPSRVTETAEQLFRQGIGAQEMMALESRVFNPNRNAAELAQQQAALAALSPERRLLIEAINLDDLERLTPPQRRALRVRLAELRNPAVPVPEDLRPPQPRVETPRPPPAPSPAPPPEVLARARATERVLAEAVDSDDYSRVAQTLRDQGVTAQTLMALETRFGGPQNSEGFAQARAAFERLPADQRELVSQVDVAAYRALDPAGRRRLREEVSRVAPIAPNRDIERGLEGIATFKERALMVRRGLLAEIRASRALSRDARETAASRFVLELEALDQRANQLYNQVATGRVPTDFRRQFEQLQVDLAAARRRARETVGLPLNLPDAP